MYKTQAEIDAMMALPRNERPAGWAWWQTQEQAEAFAAEEKDRQAKLRAEHAVRKALAAAAEADGPALNKGAGWCNKCKSCCYGDCGA
jgi:hypothetical protein